LAELLFHLTAFGHIAGHLGKPNDLASLIMDGIVYLHMTARLLNKAVEPD
jgi:hypothetical protein